MRLRKVTIPALPLLFLCLCGKAQQTVTLKGTVHDRGSKSIYLLPRTQSIRGEHKIEIPIIDHQFKYTLAADEVEAYELVFRDEYENGAWRPILFFPDTTEISFKLYPMEATGNEVKGGSINRDFYAFRKMQDEIFKKRQQEIGDEERELKKKGLFNSAASDTIMAKIRRAGNMDERQALYEEREQMEKKGAHLTPRGIVWKERFDSVMRAIFIWKYKQFEKQPNLANYYFIYEDLENRVKSNPQLAQFIRQAYKQYALAYPKHKYTRLIQYGLAAATQVFPGNAFVDVTAPDLKGKEQQLSALIKGKMALIDLWGSWCGPCIAKSRKVVPLYEKYGNKGFTVVGIAREYGDTKELDKRLAMEKFSWTHLVELDDKNSIWSKYGIPNAAGMFVLVDKNGKILAVDPTIEELEQHLAAL
ncbi:TlpA family protein disulfide reductase [Sediminibacterium ginsengisoli]|uniref:Thiol-disulfide isomerase or thioredoxin n=1 Tax=Sediminibacterium ginsengisoli TaxID=413434 RepID=A0A1T4QAH5_9BACT|nr:TlpA disulfide reductase family protein [Sediminibacterium ginsengisoli]SKA00739.1 Thiol-disulfide isomerase or thioredoxin [Sediminibacterium ginsengisoli]